jgi:hypothetical protein
MATAGKGAAGSADAGNDIRIEYGEFPFPLSDGPEESRYLT